MFILHTRTAVLSRRASAIVALEVFQEAREDDGASGYVGVWPRVHSCVLQPPSWSVVLLFIRAPDNLKISVICV